MKVFLIAVCLFLSAALALPAPVAASADEEKSYAVAASADEEKPYAVAATEDVWFYSAENEETRLFLIPCTYYVRVLDEGEVYSTVEYLTDDAPYKKLLGYCRTEQLLAVDFVPARPYLRKQVTLTYTLPDAGGLGDDALSTVERTFVYYGERTEGGQLYYYVFDGETFGYVPADEHIAYERNDDYLAALAGESEPQPAPEEEGGSSVNAVQIAVICILCAVAVAVAVLVLRGRKSSAHESSDF